MHHRFYYWIRLVKAENKGIIVLPENTFVQFWLSLYSTGMGM